MTGEDRLFSDTYNATSQRDAASMQHWQDDFLGRIRLDLISFRTLVIPDTHFFDGLLFLNTTPDRLGSELLRSKLSPSAPVEIKHRAPSLELSLATILIRGERINNFPFNSIRDEDKRSQLAVALGERTRSQLEQKLNQSMTVWDGVADFLQDVSRSSGIEIEEEIALMRRGWGDWLGGRQGNLGVSRWNRDFDLPGAARFAYFDDSDLSPEGREVFQQIWQMLTGGTPWRSDVTEVLRIHGIGASVEQRRELEQIGRFAEAVRHRAIALQHDCTYGHDVADDDPDSGRYSKLTDWLQEHWRPSDVPSVPDSAIRTLGLLPGPRWTEFMGSVSPRLEQWWMYRDESGLKFVTDRLSELLDAEGAPSGPGQSRIQLFAAIAGGTGGTLLGGAVQGPDGAAAGATTGAAFGTLSTALITSGLTKWHQNGLAKRLFEYCSSR